jgi:predicted amidophosphoribosyltransferase
VDAVEVVHGRWIEHEWAEEENGLLVSNYECSVCHSWERDEGYYCPNCGAKMDGDGNG